MFLNEALTGIQPQGTSGHDLRETRWREPPGGPHVLLRQVGRPALTTPPAEPPQPVVHAASLLWLSRCSGPAGGSVPRAFPDGPQAHRHFP